MKICIHSTEKQNKHWKTVKDEENKTGRCLRRQVNAKATCDNIRTHNMQRAEVQSITCIWEKQNQ